MLGSRILQESRQARVAEFFYHVGVHDFDLMVSNRPFNRCQAVSSPAPAVANSSDEVRTFGRQGERDCDHGVVGSTTCTIKLFLSEADVPVIPGAGDVGTPPVMAEIAARNS